MVNEDNAHLVHECLLAVNAGEFQLQTLVGMGVNTIQKQIVFPIENYLNSFSRIIVRQNHS